MTEEEIQKHLDLINAAYQFREEAAKMDQETYNRSTWRYDEEANWFFINNIDYWYDQRTGFIRLATAEEKAILHSST